MYGCEKEADSNTGISLYNTSIISSERAKWLRFVRTHHKDAKPQGTFVVCLDDFEEHCFERSFNLEVSQCELLYRVQCQSFGKNVQQSGFYQREVNKRL